MRNFNVVIGSAYKNLDTKNLPGEKWKNIPGFEEIYQVSNYGRIKSLPRYVEIYLTKYRRSIGYYTKMKIRRIKMQRRVNSFNQKPYYETTVSLRSDGIEKNFLVPRLVYSVFRKKLNFEKDELLVTHKWGDGLVNHVDNLEEISRSENLKRSYKLGKHISPFRNLSKTRKKQMNQLAVKSRLKPVVQFSLSGRRIKKFESIKAAAIKLKIPESNISGVLKKYRKSAGGYFWKYAAREN